MGRLKITFTLKHRRELECVGRYVIDKRKIVENYYSHENNDKTVFTQEVHSKCMDDMFWFML